VVLAAGLSTRMGAFKPLLPLGDGTVLESAIATLRDGGVTDVIVVTGHRGDELDPAIARARARRAHNPRFADGMYTSVQAGVAALPGDIDAFFLLPCDIPRAGAATVRELALARAEAGDPASLYPTHQGRRGHPPLIAARLIPEILAADPAGGLRELLRAHDALEIEVDEPGILRDLDTRESYLQVSGRNAQSSD
jgi:CTP:molybdopterin cytidylyltransferase MocA